MGNGFHCSHVVRGYLGSGGLYLITCIRGCCGVFGIGVDAVFQLRRRVVLSTLLLIDVVYVGDDCRAAVARGIVPMPKS